MDEVKEGWVFVDMPGEASPVLAARLVIDGGIGRFVYGKSYLARNDAFPLDPINLPLSTSTQTISGNDGVPAVLLDAGPDNWGKRLMRVLHSRQPANKLEELLATRGTGVGAIRVSMSRSKPKPTQDFQPLSELENIGESVQRVLDSNEVIPEEVLRQLEPGSSMGGARPKSVVQDDDGVVWIAKFTRPDDLFDQSRAEQLCYLMMRECGIETAETRLTRIAGRSVLLVKRFDITAQGRRHFISAHALKYQPRVRQADFNLVYSYPALADLIWKLSDVPEAGNAELFSRMVFNVLVGNTDDHLRNHGFLKNLNNHQYRLSPAYDVVPQPTNQGQQAIALGAFGRGSSVESCRQCGRYFGLEEHAANSSIERLQQVVAEWERFAEAVELSDVDRRILRPVFEAKKTGRQVI